MVEVNAEFVLVDERINRLNFVLGSGSRNVDDTHLRKQPVTKPEFGTKVPDTAVGVGALKRMETPEPKAACRGKERVRTPHVRIVELTTLSDPGLHRKKISISLRCR